MDMSLAAQLETVLRKAAGEGTALASMTVDYAGGAGEEGLEPKAWVGNCVAGSSPTSRWRN